MGCSSGAAAALSMAWYHPEWYHRVINYSGTYVNQQWPFNPKTPGGAWAYHESIFAKAKVKPIRTWMHVRDRDLLNPNVMRDDMHDRSLRQESARAGAAAGDGVSVTRVFVGVHLSTLQHLRHRCRARMRGAENGIARGVSSAPNPKGSIVCIGQKLYQFLQTATSALGTWPPISHRV
jgi:hypothetical protein